MISGRTVRGGGGGGGLLTLHIRHSNVAPSQASQSQGVALQAQRGAIYASKMRSSAWIILFYFIYLWVHVDELDLVQVFDPSLFHKKERKKVQPTLWGYKMAKWTDYPCPTFSVDIVLRFMGP
jgi:hypothetical protein